MRPKNGQTLEQAAGSLSADLERVSTALQPLSSSESNQSPKEGIASRAKDRSDCLGSDQLSTVSHLQYIHERP